MWQPVHDNGAVHASQQARLDRAAVDRAVMNTVDVKVETVAQATLVGDSKRLRGIPAVARGVSCTSPGTDPLGALIYKERRRP